MGIWLVRALALLAIAAGCGQRGVGPDGGDRAGDRVVRFAISRYEPADLQLARRQVEAFEAAHPGVRVEIVAQAWRVDTHDFFARLLALSDPAIDVYLIDDPWVPEFAYAGWIRPLDRLEAEARATMLPAGLRGGYWRDRLYAIPWELSSNALFYRKDLLELAGLPPPQTLRDLLDEAAALRDRFGLDHGLVLHASFAHNDIYPMMWASGGEVADGDRVVLDSPANLAVLEDLAAAFRDARAVPPAEQMLAWTDAGRYRYHDPIAAFENGRAAFMINWLRFLDLGAPGKPLAGKIGVLPIPGHAGGGASTVGSWYLAVSSASRDPELAEALVRHLTSPAAAVERLDAVASFPPHAALYQDRTLLRRHPVLAELLPVFSLARNRPRVPNERDVDALIEAQLHAALFRGTPPAQALAIAQTGAQLLIRQSPRDPIQFEDVLKEAAPARDASGAMWVIVGAIALWPLAGVVAALLWRRRRRRGAMFSRLATRFAVLGSATLALALATVTATSLALSVQTQQTAIAEARRFFRARVIEHALSMGRQIALGVSVAREAAGSEPLYAQAVDVLTAGGNFSEDLVVLQVLDSDGKVVSDQSDFLTRAVRRMDHGDAARVPDDPEIREVVRFGRRLTVRERPGDDGAARLEVVVPLVHDGRPDGAVLVGYSMARQEARVRVLQARQRRAMIIALAIVVVIAGVLVTISAALLWAMARRVARPLVEVASMAQRIGEGDLTVSAEAEGRDEVASLGRSINDMVVGLRERELVKDAFGRYVSPAVLDAARDGRIELGGEERTVSVLFSDIRGFTSLSERMTARDVVGMLNVYFNQMVDCVLANDGYLDKFIGDGLMAVFGAPTPCDAPALAACRAALAMRAHLAGINDQLRAAYDTTIDFGIGIHTGVVVVGNIGSSKRMQYTAIGDTVNLAARLESATKELSAGIVISEATYAAVRTEVAARALGHAPIKGKQHAVELFELIGLAS